MQFNFTLLNHNKHLLMSTVSPKLLSQHADAQISLQKNLARYQMITKEYLDKKYGIFESRKYYHYTPLNTCLSIIKSGKIWFNNYKNIESDPDEIERPYEISKEIVNELRKKSQYKEFWNDFCNVFCADDFLDRFSIYILSSSTERDDEYLWKLFGDSENGCIIGFDPSYSKIHEVSIADNQSEDLLVIIMPISYDESKLRESIKFFVNQAEQMLRNTSLISSQLYQFHFELRSSLMSNILSLLPSFIKLEHHQEKEMRRFIIEFRAKGEFYPREIPANRILFPESKKKGVVVSDLEPGDIAEIIVGKDVDEASYQIIKTYGETNRIEIIPSKYHAQRA